MRCTQYLLDIIADNACQQSSKQASRVLHIQSGPLTIKITTSLWAKGNKLIESIPVDDGARPCIHELSHHRVDSVSNRSSARPTATIAKVAVMCIAAPRPPPQSSLSAVAPLGLSPQTLPSACG